MILHQPLCLVSLVTLMLDCSIFMHFMLSGIGYILFCHPSDPLCCSLSLGTAWSLFDDFKEQQSLLPALLVGRSFAPSPEICEIFGKRSNAENLNLSRRSLLGRASPSVCWNAPSSSPMSRHKAYWLISGGVHSQPLRLSGPSSLHLRKRLSVWVCLVPFCGKHHRTIDFESRQIVIRIPS